MAAQCQRWHRHDHTGAFIGRGTALVAVDSTGQNNGTGIDLTFGINAGEGISSSRTAGPNQYGIDL